ncbi:MAG TPA: sugar phosphate isomerase/epimerase family protein [Terriglobia bacterium]|nr:sugar phosphate isomerase/epimerase family protein [Terriglobia bacterium]
MKRRDLIKSAVAGAGAALAGLQLEKSAGTSLPPAAAFTPCINQATTRKVDYTIAMDAYSKAGFRLVELWLDTVNLFLEKNSVAVARRVMADLGLAPRSACAECGNLFFRDVPEREKKWEAFERKLDMTAQLGANRFVMCSGITKDVKPSDYTSAVPMLHDIGELGRKYGIVIGIEFMRGAKFLGSVETTANLLHQVGHPNLGVLFDTFHFYAGISKLDDLERLKPGEISWVHIDDVPPKPRELLDDNDRVYVGDGVIPLEKILPTIARIYQGPVSFEVFQYADQDPYPVAKKGFDGLARLLSKLNESKAKLKPRDIHPISENGDPT